uniref:Fibronectin type III domain n=1 Tax=Candidatus Kentrum eta TaxID=2126337 RepID=A0A450VHK8_9GAMM|nr:MAG: Fibronectin type III domain [Candidatus Kentron sp. H]VFJ98753.1 MAG: Fibronectin type III domain [Candidatus Kentron sp. H]VFK04306.1 MAG: Fibronectin type III domain [Candidatus Kentron sp. H]
MYQASIDSYRIPIGSRLGCARHATHGAGAGEVRSLSAPEQGENWIRLARKKPVDGGKVANYRIERREAGGGAWTLVETVIENEATLRDQERGKSLEYRLVATNKAGFGQASNIVTAVL